MTAPMTTQITRHRYPPPRSSPRQWRLCLHEAAVCGCAGSPVMCGAPPPDSDGTRIEFDVTIDGLVDRQATASAATRSGYASWPPSPRRPQTSSGKRGRGNGIRQAVG